jgi:WD40 repeat protein
VESHSSEYENIFKRFLCFSVHPEVEVLVSVGGNDRKVLFWDYKRDEVVDTFFVEEAKVRCVKFS